MVSRRTNFSSRSTFFSLVPRIFITSIVVTLVVAGLDLFLEWSLANSYRLYAVREAFYKTELSSFLTTLLIFVGVGGFCVNLTKLHRINANDTAGLWLLAAVLCLTIFLKSCLPISSILINGSTHIALIGIVVGVFKLKSEAS